MFKHYFEETSAADIAQSTSNLTLKKHPSDCECDECKEAKEANESAVGLVGRTGKIDAQNHVTDELRTEFKKIVKKLGGKTVARQLLAEMNGEVTEGMNGKLRGELESALYTIYANCKSDKMQTAVNDILALMDTCK